MRIAINTLPLSGGHSKRGIGVYTKELINALTEFEPSHTLSYFTRPSEIDGRTDVIHYPFFDPFFLTLPRTTSKPTVVTVHDLIPIVYAEHFKRGIRGELKWQIQKRVLTRVAKSIITDSNSSKADIEQVLNFPSDRVFAIPLAPRSIFRPTTDKKRLSEVRKKYELNNKFILYVGDVNWNKNVLGLLKAFHLYAKSSTGSVQLVLVGKAFVDTNLPETQAIRDHIDRLGIKNSVVQTGFVPDSDLVALYTQAEMLVCPSFAEGFGLPVLEAMVCGCPVVMSDIPSLSEIGGPAIFVDPRNTESIAKGMARARSISKQKCQYCR